MTNSVSIDRGTSASTVCRCSACGQPIKPTELNRCPLCDFPFDDTRATGSDVTPYAKAYAHGKTAWWRMAEWVWFSNRERLKHLALMRMSAASARFAHCSFALLAIGLTLFETNRTGWRWVTDSPALEPTGATVPTGKAWFHVAAAARSLPQGETSTDFVDLWWNSIQAGSAVVIALPLAYAASWIVLALIRVGLKRAHKPPYRQEQRMTAALHYGTAWCVPLFVAALVLGLRPLAFVGTMERWSWCPPEGGFVMSAAVVAGFGAAMWWFWLIRIGATAPAKTRASVVSFLALGVPSIVCAVAVAWWFGLKSLYGPLFAFMGVDF